MARTPMNAAKFSCFRLVGTVKDINGRFLLMKIKGLKKGLQSLFFNAIFVVYAQYLWHYGSLIFEYFNHKSIASNFTAAAITPE